MAFRYSDKYKKYSLDMHVNVTRDEFLKQFDPEALAKDIISISSKPVTIAGGITKDNLKEIVLETGCLNIDIMGGSEDEPGHKNRETIKRIIEILENL